jgi:hypothetical protein
VAIHEGNVSFLLGRKVRIRDVVGRATDTHEDERSFPLRGCVSLPYYGTLKSGGNLSYFGAVYVRHQLPNHITP